MSEPLVCGCHQDCAICELGLYYRCMDCPMQEEIEEVENEAWSLADDNTDR